MFLTLDLKPSTHCSSVAAMALNRSSLLLKGFRSKDVSVLVRLYKVYVRPLLKVVSKFGTPGSTRISNVLNGSRDFSLEPYTSVLVYHIWTTAIPLLTWVYSIGESITILSCVTRFITTWLIFHLTASSCTKPVRPYYIRGHS